MKANPTVREQGPIRTTMLPYGRQTIDEDDRKAVENVLKGDWLTTGPAGAAFWTFLCQAPRARPAGAMNSRKAAPHAPKGGDRPKTPPGSNLPGISVRASRER